MVGGANCSALSSVYENGRKGMANEEYPERAECDFTSPTSLVQRIRKAEGQHAFDFTKLSQPQSHPAVTVMEKDNEKVTHTEHDPVDSVSRYDRG